MRGNAQIDGLCIRGLSFCACVVIILDLSVYAREWLTSLNSVPPGSFYRRSSKQLRTDRPAIQLQSRFRRTQVPNVTRVSSLCDQSRESICNRGELRFGSATCEIRVFRTFRLGIGDPRGSPWIQLGPTGSTTHDRSCHWITDMDDRNPWRGYRCEKRRPRSSQHPGHRCCCCN